jgi:hypothetical protein
MLSSKLPGSRLSAGSGDCAALLVKPLFLVGIGLAGERLMDEPAAAEAMVASACFGRRNKCATGDKSCGERERNLEHVSLLGVRYQMNI